jgi:hypothetical protein
VLTFSSFIFQVYLELWLNLMRDKNRLIMSIVKVIKIQFIIIYLRLIAHFFEISEIVINIALFTTF